MGRHRLARPVRAHLSSRVVADGENEIQECCAGRGELVPALAAQAFSREIHALEQFESDRMHRSLGMTASTEAAESPAPQVVNQGLGDDAARGITGAEKQHVVGRPATSVPYADPVSSTHGLVADFVARTNALMNLPSTSGAIASTSRPSPERNCRASSMP